MPGHRAWKKHSVILTCCHSCLNAIKVPSSRGGRSEAQHNAPRQGSAMPSLGVPDQRCALHKKKSQTKVQLITFAESDLNTSKLCLKGSGRPWETIPLNNSPFLTVLVLARVPNVCFTKCLAVLFSECNVFPAHQNSSHSAADL